MGHSNPKTTMLYLDQNQINLEYHPISRPVANQVEIDRTETEKDFSEADNSSPPKRKDAKSEFLVKRNLRSSDRIAEGEQISKRSSKRISKQSGQ